MGMGVADSGSGSHGHNRCLESGVLDMKYKPRKASTPVRILDILETDGMWMNVEAVEAEVRDRFGAVKMETIRRAIYRLINDQRLERRLVEFVNYNVPAKTQTRGSQSTPSGFRTHQIMEVRAA